MANKPTYDPKSRKDISNPYHNKSHSELLALANVKPFNGNYVVQKMENGRIVVNATSNRKILKK